MTMSLFIKRHRFELLVVAVSAVLVRADIFVEIELWAKEKLDWLRGSLKLEHGIPSHDTIGRLFCLICQEEFDAAFRSWVGSMAPALGAEIVAIDGKTSRRSGWANAAPQHFFARFKATPEKTPYTVAETGRKGHSRLETRRCYYAFEQLTCMHWTEQWLDLKFFAVIECEHLVKSKTAT